jgi:SAM-dependent methyltransferase
MTGLNIGCGTDIRPGYINLDKVTLPGVDIVWELTQFPYPFASNYFTSILLINVLEHIPDTIKVMEELYRLCKPGATITIRVPYWNSIEQATDITHVRSFSEFSMDYFDPEKPLGKRRSYYSNARFAVNTVSVWIKFLNRYINIRNRYSCKIILGISHHIPGITHLIEYDLTALKPDN